MAMVSERIRSSTLNPNAPLFVPAVYRQVEDFSPEWWQLVKSSTWFRDYWLSEHPEGSFDGSEDVDDDVYLPETLELEDEFEEMVSMDGSDREAYDYAAFVTNDFVAKPANVDVRNLIKDISVPKYGREASPKATSPKSPNGPAKYQVKLAQRVSSKSALRRIQQPR